MIIKAKVLGNICSDHWRKAQAVWFQNTLLLPQRVKSNSDQGFTLLSFREEPCPLSLSHGFFPIRPSLSKGRGKGAVPFFSGLIPRNVILGKNLKLRYAWLLRPRFWGISAATFEDLAFVIRSSRGVHAVDRRVCLSRASYAAAEKSEWRMAIKIWRGARLFPKTF